MSLDYQIRKYELQKTTHARASYSASSGSRFLKQSEGLNRLNTPYTLIDPEQAKVWKTAIEPMSVKPSTPSTATLKKVHTGALIISKHGPHARLGIPCWSCCNRGESSVGCSDDLSVADKSNLVEYPKDIYKPHTCAELHRTLKKEVERQHHSSVVMPPCLNKGYVTNQPCRKMPDAIDNSVTSPHGSFAPRHSAGFDEEIDLPPHLWSSIDSGDKNNFGISNDSGAPIHPKFAPTRSLGSFNNYTSEPSLFVNESMWDENLDVRHTLRSASMHNLARKSMNSFVGEKTRARSNKPSYMLRNNNEEREFENRIPLTLKASNKFTALDRPSTASSIRPKSAVSAGLTRPKSSTGGKVRPKSSKPTVGVLRECMDKNASIHRKQGRPLTAHTGVHLYTTTTMTPANCLDSINVRIV